MNLKDGNAPRDSRFARAAKAALAAPLARESVRYARRQRGEAMHDVGHLSRGCRQRNAVPLAQYVGVRRPFHLSSSNGHVNGNENGLPFVKGESAMSRILVVDANDEHCRELSQRLQFRGHEIASCETWRCALQLLREGREPFELVILNVSFHPLESAESVRAIHDLFERFHRSPSPPILCFSSHYFEPSLELELEASGARIVYEG